MWPGRRSWGIPLLLDLRRLVKPGCNIEGRVWDLLGVLMVCRNRIVLNGFLSGEVIVYKCGGRRRG